MKLCTFKGEDLYSVSLTALVARLEFNRITIADSTSFKFDDKLKDKYKGIGSAAFYVSKIKININFYRKEGIIEYGF